MGSHTWSSVLLQVILARPFSCFAVQLALHNFPRKHDGTFIGIHIIGRIPGLVEMLDEMHREVLEVRQIESVKPDHGTGAVLAVVVPVPGGCEDHVAALHRDSFAMDSCEAALTLDNEAHGECDVSVRTGYLIW